MAPQGRSRRENEVVFPQLPPTLNAGDHELQDNYASDLDRTTPYTAPYYTPYLGLRARLSQTWINKWTILLFLVLCRVLIAVRGLDNDIANAKTQALSACTSVENVGSAMASMPHYMSRGVNSMAAAGITKAVNGLMDMLMLTITGMEEIILFVINMMTSTYICLITLVVGGSLHVAIEMIQKVGDFMNQTIAGLTSDISKGVTGFQSSMNTFLSGLGEISGFFGGSKTPPTIDLSKQITALNSIKIDPTQMDADLQKLNSNIPDFAQVHNFTNTMIRLPFEEIKKLINSSVAAYTFDHTLFPVAQKQALTFCSDNNGINDFFNGLSNLASIARKIFIAVITVLAVLACIPMAYREIRRWRTMQKRAQLLQKHSFDPMDVIYIASRPYTATAGIKVASRFKSAKRQTLMRWAVAYATSLPALFVLALGVAGLFSCLCQYILLKSIQKEVPVLANQVGDFAGTVVTALNNASEAWAVSANGVIGTTNSQVNKDVFGWVNTSTLAVNNTLNMFVDTTTSILNQTFGGTILYDPIVQTLNCLIFLKIAGIEAGLTWVHDNAHVTFPEFANDTFSLGAAASITNSTKDDSFLSSPGSEASDDITAAIDKLVNAMQDTILQEVYISSGLVAIWLLILLIGLITAAIGMLGRDKTRGEGAGALTGDQRAPLSPRSPVQPQFGEAVPVDESYYTGALHDEKLGHVPKGSVGPLKKSHLRMSSHGEVADGKH